MTPTCHICGSSSVELISGYAVLKRVTSDCKPFTSGGEIGVCRDCGNAQSIIDEQWSKSCADIYADYEMYQQASGNEPLVFGANLSRSQKIVQHLASVTTIPKRGRLLDIGCGNGSMLKAFGASNPGWLLTGAEANDKHRLEVESLPNVIRFHVGDPCYLPGQFDVITLVHTLEHIPNSVEYLEKLRSKLSPNGLLLIQVPDCQQNPFALTIADHATHCFRWPLEWRVNKAGYEVINPNPCVPKEITLIAKISRGTAKLPYLEAVRDRVQSHVKWLSDFANNARSKGRVAVFGSSIAATWLFAELNGEIEYFIDEDPSRIGQEHLGKRILSLADADKSVPVLIPLPAPICDVVCQRLNAAGFTIT